MFGYSRAALINKKKWPKSSERTRARSAWEERFRQANEVETYEPNIRINESLSKDVLVA